MSSSSDSEMELDLSLDQHQRIAGTSQCGLDFCTVALNSKLEIGDSREPGHASVRQDCEACFGAEDSFWLGADVTPRCTLEKLAKQIFDWHTRNSVGRFDPCTSGAEWWCQIRHGPDGEVGFHWDKDEQLLDSCGITLCPQLSTITYLTDSGAPTMILNARPILDLSMAHELYSRPTFQNGWLSYPTLGKHVSFDGQLLHGVTSQLSGPTSPDSSPVTRVTFLVNIWLNHIPVGLNPLSTPQLKTLSNLPLRFDLGASAPSRQLSSNNSSDKFEIRFGPEREHLLSMNRPTGLPKQLGQRCSMFGLNQLKAGIHPAEEQVTLTDVPELKHGASSQEILDAFDKCQLVVVRGAVTVADLVSVADIRKLWEEHPLKVEETWNVETGTKSMPPHQILGRLTRPKRPKHCHDQKFEQWYVSFVLNQSVAFEAGMALLGRGQPTERLGTQQGVHHSRSLWVFWGENPSKQDMMGRPEHTDKVMHSGTWHAQQAGSKVWIVRPDLEADWPTTPPTVMTPGPQAGTEARLRIEVNAGDLILINTALWYHQTIIPPQQRGATATTSLSLARDFYLGGEEAAAAAAPEVQMDNLEDTWATEHVPKGTIIVQVVGQPNPGHNWPKLTTVGVPNCEIRKFAKRNVQKLIALRDISEGESLVVAKT